jgi:hypothetical protein
MRYIKFLFISAVSLFLALTALSLLLPSHLRISRVVNVAASRERTAAVIADLRGWNEWNQFVRNTPLTNKQYSTPASGKGAWLSSRELSIHETGADTNGIVLQWDLKGGKRYAGGFDLLSVNRDSLTVQWWFDLYFRWYPWEKLGAFVYDRKLGPAMEESLDTLRQFLEKSQ